MKRIVYMNGGVLCVVTPVVNTLPEPEEITEDEAVARAMARLPAAATDIRVLPESVIPASREHRALWAYNADKTAVVVDAVAAAAANAEKARVAAIAAAVSGDGPLMTLLKATPEAIDSHIDTIFPPANFTAQQRTFLKRLIKLVVSQLHGA